MIEKTNHVKVSHEPERYSILRHYSAPDIMALSAALAGIEV
jgi:hypothetical protein